MSRSRSFLSVLANCVLNICEILLLGVWKSTSNLSGCLWRNTMGIIEIPHCRHKLWWSCYWWLGQTAAYDVHGTVFLWKGFGSIFISVSSFEFWVKINLGVHERIVISRHINQEVDSSPKKKGVCTFACAVVDLPSVTGIHIHICFQQNCFLYIFGSQVPLVFDFLLTWGRSGAAHIQTN